MALPTSFSKAGFVLPHLLMPRMRVLIGSEGDNDTGKTEFGISAPGPGLVLCLDRNHEAIFHNPNPPPTRRGDFGFKVVKVPLASSTTQSQAIDLWREYTQDITTAITNPDVRTVVIDGDSDSWEFQRFAEFGRIAKVPSHLYDGVNLARRALYMKLHDSKKTIIATNKLKKHYVTQYDENGKPKMNERGTELRTWDGTYERQGFNDQNYLWHIQIRHLFNKEKMQWGLRILKCKPNRDMEGLEIWGADCNFAGLVQTVYPHISLKEWGL